MAGTQHVPTGGSRDVRLAALVFHPTRLGELAHACLACGRLHRHLLVALHPLEALPQLSHFAPHLLKILQPAWHRQPWVQTLQDLRVAPALAFENLTLLVFTRRTDGEQAQFPAATRSCVRMPFWMLLGPLLLLVLRRTDPHGIAALRTHDSLRLSR